MSYHLENFSEYKGKCWMPHIRVGYIEQIQTYKIIRTLESVGKYYTLNVFKWSKLYGQDATKKNRWANKRIYGPIQLPEIV